MIVLVLRQLRAEHHRGEKPNLSNEFSSSFIILKHAVWKWSLGRLRGQEQRILWYGIVVPFRHFLGLGLVLRDVVGVIIIIFLYWGFSVYWEVLRAERHTLFEEIRIVP